MGLKSVFRNKNSGFFYFNVKSGLNVLSQMYLGINSMQ